MGLLPYLLAATLLALNQRVSAALLNISLQNGNVCNYDRTDRVDCSLFATPGKTACLARGCCWDDSNSPTCFFINGRPVPDPLTSTIVHLFEWSWADIAKECTVLQKAGYTAVQVSPPQEDITASATGDRQEPWYTRYQPVSYKIFSRSGDRDEFAEMVSTCAASGIDIYVDAVINHMTGGPDSTTRTGRAGTQYQYRNFYGNLYTSSDFHHRQGSGYNQFGNCQIQGPDYSSCEDCVQQCDLGSLADLDTSSTDVQSKIGAYLNDLKSLGVKGVRIDAAKHINNWDLGKILQVADPSLYVYQEVPESCSDVVGPSSYTSYGQVIEFRWTQMVYEHFTARNLQLLGQEYISTCGHVPGPLAVYFVENHDKQMDCANTQSCAALTYKNGDLYKVAVAHTLAYPFGTPKVMSSYTFNSHDEGAPKQPVYHSDGSDNCGRGGWVCQHRFPEIANMIQWRITAGQAPISRYYVSPSGQVVQFTRGNKAMLFINVATSTFNGPLYNTLLPPGRYCNVYKSGCEVVQIDANGATVGSVTVAQDSAVALHVNAMDSGAATDEA
ncbi:g2223 [Coccomyxa elongata]